MDKIILIYTRPSGDGTIVDYTHVFADTQAALDAYAYAANNGAGNVKLYTAVEMRVQLTARVIDVADAQPKAAVKAKPKSRSVQRTTYVGGPSKAKAWFKGAKPPYGEALPRAAAAQLKLLEAAWPDAVPRQKLLTIPGHKRATLARALQKHEKLLRRETRPGGGNVAQRAIYTLRKKARRAAR